MNNFFVAKNRNELEKCFPVIHELRPHLDFNTFLSIYENSHKNDGYEIVAIENQGKILAVMGYRILFDLVRGKHIYIDDLVSSESVRSQGHGAELLKYAESIAKKEGCKALRLCAVLQNERGIKFYEKNAWTKSAFAFVKKL